MVDWSAIHWGDAPSWFAAVGTIGAFGTGLYLVGQDRAESRKRADDARKSQAKLVSHWHEPPQVGRFFDSETQQDMFGLGLHGWVWNHSDEPVYRVRLIGMWRDSEMPHCIKDWKVIPPHEKYDTTFHWAVPDDGSEPGRRVGSACSFTDTQGRQWLRNSSGQLLWWHPERPRLWHRALFRLRHPRHRHG